MNEGLESLLRYDAAGHRAWVKAGMPSMKDARASGDRLVIHGAIRLHNCLNMLRIRVAGNLVLR